MSVQALSPHSLITLSGLALGGFQVTTPVIIDSDFSPSPREDFCPKYSGEKDTYFFLFGRKHLQ